MWFVEARDGVRVCCDCDGINICMPSLMGGIERPGLRRASRAGSARHFRGGRVSSPSVVEHVIAVGSTDRQFGDGSTYVDATSTAHPVKETLAHRAVSVCVCVSVCVQGESGCFCAYSAFSVGAIVSAARAIARWPMPSRCRAVWPVRGERAAGAAHLALLGHQDSRRHVRRARWHGVVASCIFVRVVVAACVARGHERGGIAWASAIRFAVCASSHAQLGCVSTR